MNKWIKKMNKWIKKSTIKHKNQEELILSRSACIPRAMLNQRELQKGRVGSSRRKNLKKQGLVLLLTSLPLLYIFAVFLIKRCPAAARGHRRDSRRFRRKDKMAGARCCSHSTNNNWGICILKMINLIYLGNSLIF